MGPTEDIFRHTSIDADKSRHDVPIENFLNAQCMFQLSRLRGSLLTKFQTSAQSLLAHQNKSSRLSWIPGALTYGYQVPNADQLPATSTRSSTPLLRPPTKQTDPSLKSATDLAKSRASSQKIR